jgi:hypothetical protein
MRSACLFAGALLISAPFFAISAPRDDKGDALRTIASRVGRALGAASACPGIAPPRVKGISDKLTAVITSSSRSEDESRSVLELFNAYGEGARGVNARQIDCATADRELADLEKVSGPSSQVSAAATIAQPTTFATQLAAGPIHGITDSEIRVGASLPLTGPNKDYGHQIKVGIETAFRMANDAGGINGRMLRIIVADDGYEPTRTTETMKQLYDKEQVFGFVGNFGTATSMVAAPFALERQSLFYARTQAPTFSGATRQTVTSSITVRAMRRRPRPRCVIS